MRGLGNLLLALGVLVGVIVSAAMLAGISLPGVPWLVAVGLVKLALVSSGGLMAAGAVCLRLANRADQRQLRNGPARDDE
jgi:hypothetical protein